jgi:hypothetical protein
MVRGLSQRPNLTEGPAATRDLRRSTKEEEEGIFIVQSEANLSFQTAQEVDDVINRFLRGYMKKFDLASLSDQTEIFLSICRPRLQTTLIKVQQHRVTR